jgi:hypothetical protein
VVAALILILYALYVLISIITADGQLTNKYDIYVKLLLSVLGPLAGAFSGAFLAFGLNKRIAATKLHDERILQLTKAIFYNIKQTEAAGGIKRVLDEHEGNNVGVPLLIESLRFPATYPPYSASLRIDLESIAFLLIGHPNVLNTIVDAENALAEVSDSLNGWANFHQNTIQPKVNELNEDLLNVTFEKIERDMGKQIVGVATATISNLYVLSAEAKKRLVIAGEELNSVSRAIYPDHSFFKGAP